MYVKTAILLAMFFGPYALIISGAVTYSTFLFVLMWSIMGVGMAGIGLAVMHDANHGSYSNNKNVNKVVGYVINLIGGNALNWQIQHNVLHHSYTNVDGHDEDIAPSGIVRFSPHARKRVMHKAQHVYAWFLYGFMTLSWVTVKEFAQLKRFKDKGLLTRHGNFIGLMVKLVLWKIFYYGYALVLPIVLLPVSPWLVIASFLLMHFMAGLILGCVFQPAHVMPENDYPLPNADGILLNTWEIHQLMTTSNFAPSNKLLTWYVGGLNYQVEHHLFPNICHVHYPKISGIVKETAQEFGLPYRSHPTFAHALAEHWKMLHHLGRVQVQPEMVNA